MTTVSCVSAIIIGAGNRGSSYANYATEFPDKFQIVGVAEPKPYFRELLQKQQSISENNVFKTWQEAAAREKFADCVVITTQDQMHKEPALAFAAKHYHILLEKPMAVTYEDCSAIVESCKANDVMLSVCHVLRYSPHARKIKQLIDEGAIGEIAQIQLEEPIGCFHFAHSYVRGNWRNYSTSSFVLLTKCCHDLDLIQMWMGGKKCVSIASFGSLQHFTPSNKPQGAGARCLECKAEETCPYSAKKIYLDSVKKGYTGWPISVITDVVDIENVTEALHNGPYGRCVYDCDNDVNDNQVVMMQYEGGATVSMSMVAFTEGLCEIKVTICGSKGEITCDFEQSAVYQYDFLTRTKIKHDLQNEIQVALSSSTKGHGGADYFAIKSFVEAVAKNDRSLITTGPEESLRGHYLCFMAEKARLERAVIQL